MTENSNAAAAEKEPQSPHSEKHPAAAASNRQHPIRYTMQEQQQPQQPQQRQQRQQDHPYMITDDDESGVSENGPVAMDLPTDEETRDDETDASGHFQRDDNNNNYGGDYNDETDENDDDEDEDEEKRSRLQPINVPPSDFSIDDSLSKELLKLSFTKRVELQEEVHGVRCLAREESEDLLRESLLEFDRLVLERKRRFDARSSSSSSSSPGKPRTNRNKKNVLRNVQSIAGSITATTANNTTANTGIENTNFGYSNNHNHNHNHNNNNNSSNNHNSSNNNNENSTANTTTATTTKTNGCYLNDPGVRLRFLRAECFDVPRAVDRFVSFLELNTELFGEYVADRPIRISDFSTRREEVALQNSRNQYLPFRDRSGRRVFVGVGSLDFDVGYDLKYKMMMYLHWIASADVETQRKGVVIIAWPTNEEPSSSSSSSSSPSSSSTLGGGDDGGSSLVSWEKTIRPGMNLRLRTLQKRLGEARPLRVVCQQGYYPDTPFFRALSTLYYIGMPPHERTLYKAHFGETTELRYALLSYGIPEQLLPLSNTGTVKTANHSRWINALRAKADREERRRYQGGDGSGGGRRKPSSGGASGNNCNHEEDEEEEIVDCPGSHDVIFRKGPTYKNNPGNMYFRELIEQTHDRHMKASRKEKCLITWNIVRAIEARNGRFLDWSKKWEMWIVARDREKIRTKVAACYKRYNRTAAAEQRKHPPPPPASAAVAMATLPPRRRQQQQSHPSQQRSQHQQQPQYPTLPPSLPLSFEACLLGGNLDPDTHHGGGYNAEANSTRLRRGYFHDPQQQMFPSKRRKTFSLFCGAGYNSSSDSSNG